MTGEDSFLEEAYEDRTYIPDTDADEDFDDEEDDDAPEGE